MPGLYLQLGLYAIAAVKFAWTLPAILRGLAERPTRFNGKPMAEGIGVWVACYPQLIDLARRAREIAVSLGMA